VAGDLLGGRARLEQQPRRAGVLELALAGRERHHHGVRHQRMHERERWIRPQYVRPRQRPRGLGDARLVETGEARRYRDRDLVAEDRDGLGGGERVRLEPSQPQRHRPRHGPRPDGPHDVGVARDRTDAVELEPRDQLAHEQRVSARRRVARGHEGVVGLLTRSLREDAGNRLGAERARRQRHGGDLADGVEQVLVGIGLARPDRGQQQDRQLLDATRQVGEKAQRGAIRPLEIVDGKQQRPLFGEVENHPEQSVQHGEPTLAGTVALRAGEVGEHRSGRIGYLARPRGRFEQLARHAEAELALEPAGARPELAQVAGDAAPRLVEHGRLPDPGRAFDQHHGAAPLVDLAHRLLDRRQLAVSLQRDHGVRPLDNRRRS
jgi:hypothetical protein